MNFRATVASALLASVPAVSLATVTNDQVLSQHIKEADGTSLQNTNAGSGVKTGHIQNGAVTTQKLGIPYAAVVSAGQSIQAAINGLAGCAAATPCAVKVMPGVYNLGTAQLLMRSFVDVVGSGPGNTVIQSSVGTPVTSDDSCAMATVKMASDSTISDLSVVNVSPAAGSHHVIGIAFDGIGAAQANRVEVVVGHRTNPAMRSIGVCATGPTTHAILDGISVEAQGSDDQGNAIRLEGDAAVTVSNSKLVAKSETGNTNVLGNSGSPGNLYTVHNCYIEGKARWVNGINTYAGTTIVTNSRIVLNGSEDNAFIAVDDPDVTWRPSFTMHGSIVTLNGPVAYGNLYTNGVVNIATSQLPGDRSRLGANATLVHNYDEAFVAIPDQVATPLPVP